MDAPDQVYRLPVSEGTRLLLVLLWRYAGEGSLVVWPSAARLAQITGFAERSIRRQLAGLAELGAIERCERPAAAATAGKAWRLNPDPSVTMTRQSCGLASHADSPVTPALTRRSATPDPSVLPTVTDGSDRTTREPPENHQAEPPGPDLRSASPLVLIAPDHPKPKPKPKAWADPETEAAVREVLDALGSVRAEHGMPQPHAAPPRLKGTSDQKSLAAKIRDLTETEGSLEAAVTLLKAVFSAKGAEHARSDSDRFRGGQYLVVTTALRPTNWPGWEAAGRAWLDGHRPSTPSTRNGSRYSTPPASSAATAIDYGQ